MNIIKTIAVGIIMLNAIMMAISALAALLAYYPNLFYGGILFLLFLGAAWQIGYEFTEWMAKR